MHAVNETRRRLASLSVAPLQHAAARVMYVLLRKTLVRGMFGRSSIDAQLSALLETVSVGYEPRDHAHWHRQPELGREIETSVVAAWFGGVDKFGVPQDQVASFEDDVAPLLAVAQAAHEAPGALVGPSQSHQSLHRASPDKLHGFVIIYVQPPSHCSLRIVDMLPRMPNEESVHRSDEILRAPKLFEMSLYSTISSDEP